MLLPGSHSILVDTYFAPFISVRIDVLLAPSFFCKVGARRKITQEIGRRGTKDTAKTAPWNWLSAPHP